MASVKSKKPAAMETPRQIEEVEPSKCPPRKRPPPAAIRKSTARIEIMTASVSNHPAMSSQAGKVKR
jgi:hypothetical protein